MSEAVTMAIPNRDVCKEILNPPLLPFAKYFAANASRCVLSRLVASHAIRE